jgi:hypothetical protein
MANNALSQNSGEIQKIGYLSSGSFSSSVRARVEVSVRVSVMVRVRVGQYGFEPKVGGDPKDRMSIIR